MRRFSGRPQFFQYCTASFSATSTAVEPSSEKKTWRSGAGTILPRRDREFFSGLVRKSREENVFEPRGLFGDGRGDGRVRVAVQVHPPGRNRIQNLPPVLRFEKNAFAAANGKRRRVHAFVRERDARDGGRMRS